MLKGPALDRRTIVLGGLALPLASCGQPPGGGDGGNSGAPWIDPGLVATVATIGLIAGGVQVIGTVAGLAALARVAGMVSSGASILQMVDAIDRLVNRRAALSAPPPAPRGPVLEWLVPAAHAADSISGGGIAPRPAAGNDLTRVPFLSGTTEIQITARNDTSQDFLAHNVYSTVRRVGWPPPTSVDELTGSTALPSFVMSMPAGQSFTHPLRVDLPVNEGFIVYSWCVPTDTLPDTNLVMNNAMIGPVLYNCDPYDQALLDAVASNRESTIPPTVSYEMPV